ncbi:hypothetical protein [Flaviaesturariibacter terrae]
MNQLTEVNTDTLVSILAQLRSHNPQIGNYVSSTVNPDGSYAVQLDNGNVEIPARMVNEYGRVAPYKTESEYRSVAAGYVAHEVPAEEEKIPLIDPAIVPESKAARMRRLFITGILLVLAVIFLLTLLL